MNRFTRRTIWVLEGIFFAFDRVNNTVCVPRHYASAVVLKSFRQWNIRSSPVINPNDFLALLVCLLNLPADPRPRMRLFSHQHDNGRRPGDLHPEKTTYGLVAHAPLIEAPLVFGLHAH